MFAWMPLCSVFEFEGRGELEGEVFEDEEGDWVAKRPLGKSLLPGFGFFSFEADDDDDDDDDDEDNGKVGDGDANIWGKYVA